jgi:hypothetical protein
LAPMRALEPSTEAVCHAGYCAAGSLTVAPALLSRNSATCPAIPVHIDDRGVTDSGTRRHKRHGTYAGVVWPEPDKR